MPRYTNNSDYIARADQAWDRHEQREAMARFDVLQVDVKQRKTGHHVTRQYMPRGYPPRNLFGRPYLTGSAKRRPDTMTL